MGTVGRKAELGVAIIVLGLLALLLPWSSATVASLDFVPSDAYSILTGTVYALGIIVILAGIAVLRLKEEE
jgi:hypothetical protein